MSTNISLPLNSKTDEKANNSKISKDAYTKYRV